MCNSISIIAEISELTEQFQIDNVLSYTKNRYEINPTQSVSAIIVQDNKRLLDEFRWGLVPFWAKDSVMIDREAILEKSPIRRIAKKQRCVIPCSGFYASVTTGKRMQWVKFTLSSGTFGIAGLYEVWREAGGEELRTCNMLMTPANAIVAPYQDIMPAILDAASIDTWLLPEMKDPDYLRNLLRPMDELRMTATLLASPKGKFDPDSGLSMPRPELA